jgi:D-lactate dehydrogenase (cytochrome)
MRTQVLALEIVLADGRTIRTGSRAIKSSAGYSLTSLFVGSEGTLGVITELTLRLYGLPEHTLAARASFPSAEAACRAAAAMIGSGVSVTRVELLDAQTIAAVNAYKGTAYAEEPSLFLEFAGSKGGVAGDLETAREAVAGEGGSDFAFERETEARSRLWEARHHALFALQHASPGKVHRATDVCVPVSELAGAIEAARRGAEERGLDAAVVGHVGDGNYHVLFMLDPDDPDELAAAAALNQELVDYALARGGTCTGEHGIGLGKIGYLEREHGDLVPLMRGIKRLLDPNGILNPGKIVG